jgi:TPP-dependent pyruvate/acetoin dehydrogenase alpha subunit
MSCLIAGEMIMFKEDLIAFEKTIYDIFETGVLPFLIHMSGGNEDQLLEIFEEINENDYVFASHRAHYHYLLKGGEDLEEKIRNGDSMFLFNKQLKFFTSSVLAGTCGIAAGVALSFHLRKLPHKVWCFLGDGAEDEGHFYEAAKFVESLSLPCTFIIEDNDRSVVANKVQRGSTAHLSFKCVKRYEYSPTYPHGGTGTKTWVKFK